MNVRQMIMLLKASAAPGVVSTKACLAPEVLATVVDSGLNEGGTAAHALHLASCDYCLGQLSVLSRAAAEQHRHAAVPASVIARAEALFDDSIPARATAQWRWAVPLAAAAALILAIALRLGPAASLKAEAGGTIAPPTRYVTGQLQHPSLVLPAEGGVVRPLEQVFRWTEVPGALFYEVRLVSLGGDLLLRERVDDTRWLIPKGVNLGPGDEYFVRIDAYLSDAKYLSSEHRLFRVEGAQ